MINYEYEENIYYNHQLSSNYKLSTINFLSSLNSLSEVLLPPPVVVPGLLLVLVAASLTNHPGSEQWHSSGAYLYFPVFICNNNIIMSRLPGSRHRLVLQRPDGRGLARLHLCPPSLVSTL